ncbi:acetyltransferase [Trichoderma arundinaceum]|uniref:Acetyltransferase n=1 Tax=Trichoderma arundinaceum TaxID=490622 RepID=A0A395N8Q3_TRIAR|nr:acetyltransferase [Trichoderma arundinaceum]
MAALSQQAINKGLSIRKATADDVPAVQSIVNASYSKYIERMGKPPAPMIADYHELLNTRDIYILESISDDSSMRIVGSIILGIDPEEDAVKVNNLVVEPAAQGRGYGRVLMDFAEDVARENQIKSMALFTNVKMHENIGLYLKLGYVETERKSEDGYDRVYFRKRLLD